uniref:ARAD1D49874p n=1 Tax=Blastobotrys adeninivorans TaxID=409370 RepID=A0A060TJV8_BLAAD
MTLLRLITPRLARLTSTSTFRNFTMSYGPKAAERIAGKTVLITGASSGIGAATARELADASGGSLRLILTARRVDRLNELKQELTSKYSSVEVLAQALDISKHAEVPKFVDSLPSEWQDIDVLINNAGMVHGVEKVGEIKSSDVEVMFNTNVLGLIALTQSIVPRFKAKGSGDIVNIGSIAGLDPYPGGAIYCATKAALRSFTHSLRKETIDTRIRVMEIQPGAVETEFSIVRFRGDKSKADAVYAGTEPLVAEDIAEVITFNLTRRQNTVIADTLVFPSHQASASHIHRKN